MKPYQIEKLANQYKNKDSEIYSVLMLLSGCKELGLSKQYVDHCREFGSRVIYEMQIGNYTIEDLLNS